MVESRTETDFPIRAKERVDIEDPQVTVVSTDSLPTDPTCAKPMMLVAEPNLAKERTEREDARQA
jgi:hypothetical protein